jgi:hypothetical protein
MSKKLWVDMIAGSQLRDTQGEMLSVEGADISELEASRGRINDNHGKGFTNSIGRITEAKKIFKAEDCDSPRHTYYWNKIKAPYIYCKGYLYNDDDHQNAKAAAAILRNIHKEDSPLQLKASVEGGVLQRGLKDERLLAQTKIHSVALTFTPANHATLVEPLDLAKTMPEPGDMQLIESVKHLAQDNVPSFRHIVRTGSATKVHENLHKIDELVARLKGHGLNLDIPSPQNILESSVESKIDSNIKKIRNLVSTLCNDDLEKNLKGHIAGAALMGALAAAPNITTPSNISTPTAKPAIIQEQHKTTTPAELITSLKVKHPHMYALAGIESSWGHNLDHKKDPKSGTTAGGPWGMMPHTVGEVLKMSKNLRTKYPELAEKAKNIKANHEFFTKTLTDNPNIAFEFAKSYYNFLHKKSNGNIDKTIHSWYWGPTGTEKAIARGKNIGQSEYVTKFKRALSTGEPTQAAPKKVLAGVKKALTAGYGGAGAPTGRVGGNVFQAESLVDDRNKVKGFQYTSCPHCGDEQIYMKSQTKCRGCGKPWPLEKIFKLIQGNK